LQERVLALQDTVRKREKYIKKLKNQLAKLQNVNHTLTKQANSSKIFRDRASNLTKKNAELEATLAELQEQDSPTNRVRSFVSRILQDPKLCQKLTRHTPDELRQIETEISTTFARITLKGDERINNRSKEDRFTVLESVFVTLYWLKCYPRDVEMQAIFGLHFRTLSDWILRTLSAIVQKYKNVIKWPSDEEFKNLKSEFNPQLPRALQRVVCAVDGTEIRVSAICRGTPIQSLLQQEETACT
jgi:hypothetical protein